MARYESLDWLRGLMALTIMTYHLVSWQLFHPKAGNILGNFGIYGVSIFFVLSGLSMALAYHHFIKDIKSYISFFIRRIFRIWPLLWLAIILISIESFRLYAELDSWKIFLNLTTLFGFISPTEYINIGAWSIGNEIVYYSLTPLLIVLYNYKKILGNTIVFFSIIIGLYFSFYLLHSDVNLSKQWGKYINPFNNLFLYFCGIALYYNFKDIDLKNYNYVFIIISLIIFIYYPVYGDQITIVTGANRIVFSTASILLTLGFYKLNYKKTNIFTFLFANLGETTYGIYLLHPLVYYYIILAKITSNPLFIITSTIILTLIVAKLAYIFYEKPLIKIGKRVT